MLMRGIGDIVLESPHHGCVPHHPVSNITSSCNQPYPPTPQLTSIEQQLPKPIYATDPQLYGLATEKTHSSVQPFHNCLPQGKHSKFYIKGAQWNYIYITNLQYKS